MNLYIYPPVIMYLLGMVLVIGMFESMDDNNKGTLKLSVVWPFVAIWLMYEMIRDMTYGDRR
tara:strand:+ start:1088 stop:1273 length:186 start_codon:yes stop_codon:yes gene_type:complete